MPLPSKGWIVTSQALGLPVFYLVSPRPKEAGSTGKKLYAWSDEQKDAHVFKERQAARDAYARIKSAVLTDGRNAPHHDYIMVHDLSLLI